MFHSIFPLTVIDKSIRPAHDVGSRIAIDTQLEIEQITRRLQNNFPHLGNRLFDPLHRVLDQKAVMSATDDWDMG